ncbi:MAG: rRNA maturation RNase YbeY [Tenericutes bacterium]|nr:rRNA maturation RNase YbeY [Mycoplasmatota bacterium]
MIKINYVNQYNKKNAYKKAITKMFKKAYRDLELIEKVVVSVIFVTNEAIQELNKNFRNLDQATDVLSFENIDDLEEVGDIFISIDKVEEQAKELAHSFEYELVYLAVHGLLHCLGYDHIDDEDALEMDKRQKLIMSNTKYTR